MSLFDEYRKIALEDAKAARLLLENGFYPHAIYFASQSLEKIRKTYFLARGLANTIEEIRKIDAHHSPKSWVNVWEKERRTWTEFQSEKDQMTEETYNSLNPEAHIEQIDSIIKEIKDGKTHSIDDAVEHADKKFEELKAIKRSIEDAREQLIQRHRREQRDEKILQQIRFEERADKQLLGGVCLGYAFAVAYQFSFVLPAQDRLRYPEGKPLDTYAQTSPITRNLGKIIRHAIRVCEIMEQLHFEGDKASLKNEPLDLERKN